jgi:hypothetical protein
MKRFSLSVERGGGTFNATRKGKWRRIQFETATIVLSICWYFTGSTPFSLIFQLPSPTLNSSTLYRTYVQHKSCPEATVDRPVPGKQNDKWNKVE